MNENNPTYITIPKGEMICNDGFMTEPNGIAIKVHLSAE